MTISTSAPSPYSSKIKIFLDGADRGAMLEFAKDPNVQGFTTNPSLMKKSGVKDYKSFCVEMLQQIQDKPISFEVFADDLETMHKQALEIASWSNGSSGQPAKNTYVKIPVMN